MRLYNTYSRAVEELPPPPGPIRMYFCGPTVYRRIHVGNAFAVSVLPIWLKRWLEQRRYETKLAVNVTDINDKIYDAAPGASAQLADQATRWYVEDTDDLGLGRPDVEPTAVETVTDQIRMIEELIAGGFAYEVERDVYFRVPSFPEYGRLSGQRADKVEEQEPNARKEDPRDFALWKANKPGEDTWWDSPWGRGRPGWHIECSAMSEKHLGTEFEIHGGGLDLIFPHHENEIAQSRSLGHRFARLWMHNGMLRFRGEEMHKSLGNDVSLREALDEWGREALLVFFLTGHWRKPLDYSEQTMTAAASQAARFRNGLTHRDFERLPGVFPAPFIEALEDDFNTPAALALMHRWLRDDRPDLVYPCLEVFGLTSLAEVEPAPASLIDLAEKRRAAKAHEDYREADRLRAVIAAAGWEVRDIWNGYRLFPRK